MGLIKFAEGELLANDIPAHQALADIEVTNRFIKLAESLKRLAPRSDDFMYFTAIMLHGAEAALIDPKTGESRKDNAGKDITGVFDDNWKWVCSDTSIDPYSNQNGDIFPSSELKKAYTKWRGRPLCINHQSSDVEGVRGIIIDTHWDDKYKRVVGLCALDKKSYPDLAHKVKAGYANCVSMGTAVGRALCTVCQKTAVTEKDYCDCIRSKKGMRINGVKVGEINLDLNPIELSLVVTPADQQAKVLKIIASMNNYADQRKSLVEEKDRVETGKLAKLDDSIKVVQAQLNRLFTECTDVACQFVRGEDGHIKLIKSAQEHQYSWRDFFDTARDIAGASDYDKRDLFDSLNQMRQLLTVEDLRNNTELLMEFADVMGSKNKYLHEAILQPVLDELKSTEHSGALPPMQENQFTTPNGPDKDLGLDSGSEVTLPANEQDTGARIGKVVNPGETGPMPDKSGDTGPEMAPKTPGNFASNEEIAMLMAKGGKKTADIEENLNLLLKQTQEIEKEMNTMKENLNTNNNTVAVDTRSAKVEDSKMNEARLKFRAAQRKALLSKQAEKKVCEECEEVECKCEEKKEKKAWFLGTEEPKPGQVQYKPENGGEPKIRMNDKQMHQDKSMGGADKAFPGDEADKKKLLRADLEARALQRRAYWLGTEEPKPGKEQYKKDPGAAKGRNDDKHMHQDGKMGGDAGSFPGDEAEKKKLLRAELVPGALRTKFTMLRNADASFNKKGSYLEVFVGANKVLKATAEEIYGDQLNEIIPNHDGTSSGKTGWEVLQTPEYGKEVMSAIRSEGFNKVARMLKGAQAAPAAAPPMPMPELPPAMEAGAPAAGGEAPEMKQVDVNEVMSLLGESEDKLDQIRSAVTGETDGEVKDVSVETGDKDAAEAAGAELTASLVSLSREVYAELDRSADELALLVEYFKKSASLSSSKKAELNKIAVDAVSDSKALLEEADTILAVAGKVPAGLKAFQDKQKAKKKGGDKDEDKADKKDKDKKDDKKEDKKDKKDDKKKDKKKSKKAELAEALLKLAGELNDEDMASDGMDDFDEALADLGLLPEEGSADDELIEHGAPDMPQAPAAHRNNCGMCGMAMDAEHLCTASAKDELVREALASRKARREALLKSAEEKQYDVTPDMHGHEREAHGGGGETTQLDIKPAGDAAKVETIDEIHKKMMDAAEAAPSGKEGSSAIEVKEAAIKAELELDLKVKKAEEDKTKFRVKLRRAYDLGLQMQEKGMVPRTKEALDLQVDEIMKFDDRAFESYKRVVANTNAAVKTASVKSVPQPGVREDNSQPGDNGGGAESLSDQLTGLWK